MTVTAHPKDTVGAALQTKITNLTNAQAAVGTTSTKTHLAALLNQTQREAVLHFIEHARLPTASMILTMLGSNTVAPAGLDKVGTKMFNDIVSTANRVNAMKPGPAQEAGNRQLDQLQREMMVYCMDIGFTTAAQILSNMS